MPSAGYIPCGKDTVCQHACKNSGNRVPVWSPPASHKLFVGMSKSEVLHSIDTTRKGQNLSASFPMHKKYSNVFCFSDWHTCCPSAKRLFYPLATSCCFLTTPWHIFKLLTRWVGWWKTLLHSEHSKGSLSRESLRCWECSDGRLFNSDGTQGASLGNGAGNAEWGRMLAEALPTAGTGKASPERESCSAGWGVSSDGTFCHSRNTDRLFLQRSRAVAISNQIHLVSGQLWAAGLLLLRGLWDAGKMRSLDKSFAALETLVAVLTLNSHAAVDICTLGQGLPIWVSLLMSGEVWHEVEGFLAHCLHTKGFFQYGSAGVSPGLVGY